MWQSTKPGRTSWPSASITLVPWCAKFFDVGVGADGDDFVAANGERLGPGLLGIERVDFAVQNDRVGAALCFFLRFWRDSAQRMRRSNTDSKRTVRREIVDSALHSLLANNSSSSGFHTSKL